MHTAIENALTVVTTSQPFFASVLAVAMRIEENPDCPFAAATDGRTVFVRPADFAAWPMKTGAGVLVHEVCHKILRHMERAKAYKARGFGPDGKTFEWDTYNVAADLVINRMVKECGLDLPAGALFDPRVTSNDQVDEVYCMLRAEQGTQDAQDAQDGDQGTQDAQDGDQGTQDAQDGDQGTQDAQDGDQGTQDAQDGDQGTQD